MINFKLNKIKYTFKLMPIAIVMTCLVSYHPKAGQTVENRGTLKIQGVETTVTSILTAEDQAGTAADEIIGRLKKGGKIL
jgi:predicted transcriptional regulator